ncbi:hypothetical protein EVAR_46239_1 [Eumeta japonica]|uniref:Uncharacterized protein n=1 Tax=Eumeta variegata TaxID=151549 RepID=A0A4C1XQJ6_EUMVA|nr:hypothetical protein EVAR_46239_1 [Eumeta japonica]
MPHVIPEHYVKATKTIFAVLAISLQFIAHSIQHEWLIILTVQMMSVHTLLRSTLDRIKLANGDGGRGSRSLHGSISVELPYILAMLLKGTVSALPQRTKYVKRRRKKSVKDRNLRSREIDRLTHANRAGDHRKLFKQITNARRTLGQTSFR